MSDGQQGIPQVSIFYSYAHKDEALRDRLDYHLSSLQRQGLISAWHDRKVVAGTEWAYDINAHLQTASIILLLISPDFMDSDYCMSIEVQQAMVRHNLREAKVIPILLSPADWHDAPFAILQCLPSGAKPVMEWDNPDEAFANIAEGIRQAIEEMSPLLLTKPIGLVQPLTLSSPFVPERDTENRSISPTDVESRKRMIVQVRALWITGLLKTVLQEAALITPEFQEWQEAISNPWLVSLQEMNQPPRPLSPNTHIIEIYDRAAGQLLILGEPGSGKTTILLELTRDLLIRAERDDAHPIPVIFLLSTWATRRLPIEDWLVEELVAKYQVPRKLGQRWVESYQILPLLDGLDEVMREHRAACIEALNSYRERYGLLPMVVCSRSADYLAQNARVLLQTAVILQPFTQKQIERYLLSQIKQSAPIREAIQQDETLRELVSTPLMLSIVKSAYNEASIDELLAIRSPEARRRLIFATYIQKMFQRREINTRYSPQQILDWLTYLASQMTYRGQTEFRLEQLQPDWLLKRQRDLYQWSTGLAIGLCSGLLVGLPLAVIWLPYGSYGQGLGLDIGALVGLVSGVIIGLNKDIQPVEVVQWSWRGMPRALIICLLVGLFSGFFIWLLLQSFNPPAVAVGGGVIFGGLIGLICGSIYVLYVGLSMKQMKRRAHFSPNEGIKRSWKNGLLRGLFAAMIAGLPVGLFVAVIAYQALPSTPSFEQAIGNVLTPPLVLFYTLLFSLLFGVYVGGSIGWVVGWIFGLIWGLASFAQHFVLRCWLWRTKRLPLDMEAFLNEATARVLLRQVGGSYFFIHRLLLDYFASLEPLPPAEENLEEEKISSTS